MPAEGTASAKDIPQAVEVKIGVTPDGKITSLKPDPFYVSKGRAGLGKVDDQPRHGLCN
jgi:hypothetical protein